jgi:hypothetical protein
MIYFPMNETVTQPNFVSTPYPGVKILKGIRYSGLIGFGTEFISAENLPRMSEIFYVLKHI